MAGLGAAVLAAGLALLYLVGVGKPEGQYFLFEGAVDRPPALEARVFEFDSQGLWLHPRPGFCWFGGTLLLLAGLATIRFSRGPRTVVRALLLALLALLLWACALEVLRVLEPETVFSRCTTVAWRLRPNLPLPPQRLSRPDVDGVPAFRLEDTLFSNSVGLREREIAFEKPPGEVRILCLGHSWTFGWGVAAEEAWPRQLETLLNHGNPRGRVVVVNAGMPGSTPMQAYLMLQRVGLRYQPDLVIVGGLHPGVELPDLDELWLASTWLGRSLAWGVLRESAHLARASGSPPAAGTGWYTARLDTLLEENGIPAIAFGSPTPPPPEPSPNPRFLWGDFEFEGTLGFTPRAGLKILRVVIPRGLEADRFLIRDEPGAQTPHPSVLGHETIARGVADALRALPEAQAWLQRMLEPPPVGLPGLDPGGSLKPDLASGRRPHPGRGHPPAEEHPGL